MPLETALETEIPCKHQHRAKRGFQYTKSGKNKNLYAEIADSGSLKKLNLDTWD